jgi:hypothetical protein
MNKETKENENTKRKTKVAAWCLERIPCQESHVV